MGDIKIKEAKNIEKLKINELSNIDPLVISEVRHIAPAAVHVKELNHIDPISIESLRVNEIRNLDPIRVEKFNVTNLPTVNISLRQLPAVDMNIRRIPPVSVGLHQDFCIPSVYTLRAQFLGIEFLRFNVNGHTMIAPKDKVRREQARTPGKSFPEVAVAGNPSIPSRIYEKGAKVVMGGRPCSSPGKFSDYSQTHFKGKRAETGKEMASSHQARSRLIPSGSGLRVGAHPSQTFPATSFGIRERWSGSVGGGEG